ncbi:MAG TPA: ABC transporter ATP-binding protein [Pirellulaceae bacterium]|nr:ABC transporter ATP-binding protein [Pirellulaceae bacterium]HMO93343.1 ABC transporter ATP-binding protein [Pirellulaceae bacterium]HMP70114.1 ABC transporter ATP-binding protein [Pirellulaceae bacterium]
MMATTHSHPLWAYGLRRHRDPQPGAVALSIEHLKIAYPGQAKLAVDDVSLTIDIGRRVALVGPNGAGKSTLLKSIVGLIQPREGIIRIYGNAVGACHHRTAYLPQRIDLDWRFPMTVKQLVMTGRYVHLGWFKRPSAEDWKIVLESLERLGIRELANSQIGELSGGQQQRTLLARALAQESSLFLLDEPLNAVDEKTREVVDDVLREHALRGGSVFAATHDLVSLEESFDESIHVVDGKIDRVAQYTAKSGVTCLQAPHHCAHGTCP